MASETLCADGIPTYRRQCQESKTPPYENDQNLQVICKRLYELFVPINCWQRYFFDFEMNRILLLPCRLLLRMHLARSCLNDLQKPYAPMVFLHTAGNVKKARPCLARVTKTCNQLMSSHAKYESDLLPTGDIWPYDSSYKLAANPQRIWCLILTFKYSYCLTGLSTIYWCWVNSPTSFGLLRPRSGPM